MINRVILVGRLTKDVEVSKTQSGLSVANFTVACDRRGSRNQEGGQQADFINCTAWRQSADFLGQYAKKGAMIGVEGRIQTDSYERDGQRVYTTKVNCDSVQLLESRSQSEARAQNSSSYQNDYQPSYEQPAASTDEISSDDFGSESGLDISSDDLPF